MAENASIQSPFKINCRQNGSFSSELLTGFVSKGCNNEMDSSITSPTSILDAKPFNSVKSPKSLWESRGASLGLLEALIDDQPGSNQANPSSPKVLFGSQMKIQVPLLPSVLSPNDSPKSPADFGIKTRTCQVGPFSPSSVKKPGPGFGSLKSGLSASEMKLSEDYTCVISYDGPSPKTIHIFDDCIVEKCCGAVKGSELREGDDWIYPNENFLSFCHGCRTTLGEGKDVYMYRGEKAFCSSECRCKEMQMEEERLANSGSDEYF